MWNTRLDEEVAGVKNAGRNISNLRYADDTTLMTESEEKLKSLLMKVKEDSEKAGLKLNNQKMKIMTSGPITSWKRDGETMESVTDLSSWTPKSLKITVAMKLKDTCSLEKSYDHLESILKSRNIALPAKFCLVKAMVFPVIMYGCDSWPIKKAEHQRINAFELWCWRRHLRVPWASRRSNQSILKEISPEYSLEGLMLKLKLQYFDHLMRRADSPEKTLMLGKVEGRRRKGQKKIRW